MSLSSRSSQYGKVLGDWNIRKVVGKGSNGTSVYQIVRKDKNWEEFCALKAIPIISERGNYHNLSARLKDEYQKTLLDRTEYARREVQNMLKVRGRTNIVDYFDHNVAEWEDENEFGCDLLIRMELLHDLRNELKRGRIFSEAEVIQIGKDICSALVVCHGKDILHRDIKPENIFFNDDGDYKLGDFGIARILDKCPGSYASTGIGTPEYAAPEQGTGTYDMRVDIYSLGLVLFELANQNRLPFAVSSYVRPQEVEKRILAQTLPRPCDASDALAKVILKACAHDPAKRYRTAQEMLDALNQLRAASPAEAASHRNPASSKRPDPVPAGNDFETEPALPDLRPAGSGKNSAVRQSDVFNKIFREVERDFYADAPAKTPRKRSKNYYRNLRRGGKHKVADTLLAVAMLCVVAAGIILWSLEYSWWICLGIVLGASVILSVLELAFGGELKEELGWKEAMLTFAVGIPLLTALIIAVTEGISAAERWLSAFFA